MAAFLLWNVRGKPLDGLVHNLVRHFQIDLVLLVEYPLATSHLPGLLLSEGLFKRPSSERFGVFARAGHRLSRLRYGLTRRVNMWKLVPPSGREGLLVLLHGLDRRNYDDSTRRFFFGRVADAVRRRERAREHKHTLVAGDFNAQPFESAVADADGLHAMGMLAVRNSTSRRTRGGGAATDFFYNPMWRAYGHQRHPEAGAATHYWLGSWAHELGWFMLDQVVIRPGESARFPEDQLQIVTQVGGVELLDPQGLPDSHTASDHLPMVFHWNL